MSQSGDNHTEAKQHHKSYTKHNLFTSRLLMQLQWLLSKNHVIKLNVSIILRHLSQKQTAPNIHFVSGCVSVSHQCRSPAGTKLSQPQSTRSNEPTCSPSSFPSCSTSQRPTQYWLCRGSDKESNLLRSAQWEKGRVRWSEAKRAGRS